MYIRIHSAHVLMCSINTFMVHAAAGECCDWAQDSVPVQHGQCWESYWAGLPVSLWRYNIIQVVGIERMHSVFWHCTCEQQCQEVLTCWLTCLLPICYIDNSYSSVHLPACCLPTLSHSSPFSLTLILPPSLPFLLFSFLWSLSYGSGNIMIGFSNGFFVIISTHKDEIGQVRAFLWKNNIHE